MQIIKINCTITTLEDFHIGTGSGNIGLYDDGQHKDNDGVPTINASTMKGLLRDSCAALDRAKRSLGLPVNEDLFSKLFVNFDNLSSLDIDIKPINPPDTLKANTLIHYFTAVEHTKRKAKNSSLRSMEFGAKGLEYQLELRYLNRSDDSEQLCQYLLDGLKNIKSIGGHRRRGFGAIAMACEEPLIEEIACTEPPQEGSKQLKLIFELAEDTIISSKAQSGNLLNTNDYIPGATILGMFRSLLLAQGLQSTYLDEDKVSASFFYPMPKDHNSKIDIDVIPAFISFRRKKAYLTASACDAGISLTQLPSWALNTANSDRFADMLSNNTLKNDDEHTDQGKGIYDGYILRKNTDALWNDARYYKVSKLYHQRNSIDPKKQSTSDAGIFIEEKLKRGTCFLGSLSFASSADCTKFKQEFASWLQGTLPLHIGRGGKAIYVKQFCETSSTEQCEVSFNNSTSFTISLLSDTILYNDALQPSTHITTDILASLLGEDFDKEHFELLSYVTRSGVISAFSGASGLRRFRDLAIRKGSCYSFKYLGADAAGLHKRLGELAQNGIGYRKQEGFGCIAINHPLHNQNPSPPSNTQLLEVSGANLTTIEKNRLTQKAMIYNDARQIGHDIKKLIDGKLWTSMAADALMQIESGMCLTKLKERYISKMDKETPGAWDEKDSRYKIAKKLIEQIEKQTPAVTIATALKLLLEGKGDMK